MKSIAQKRVAIIGAILIITATSAFAFGGSHNGGNHNGGNHNSGSHNGNNHNEADHNSGCYSDGKINHNGTNHYSNVPLPGTAQDGNIIVPNQSR